MQTRKQDLTADSWTLALDNGGRIKMSGATGAILVTLTTGEEPPLDAPAHLYQRHVLQNPGGLNFDPGVKLYMRSYEGNCSLVVSS